jgi:hypothetical protein
MGRAPTRWILKMGRDLVQVARLEDGQLIE